MGYDVSRFREGLDGFATFCLDDGEQVILNFRGGVAQLEGGDADDIAAKIVKHYPKMLKVVEWKRMESEPAPVTGPDPREMAALALPKKKDDDEPAIVRSLKKTKKPRRKH